MAVLKPMYVPRTVSEIKADKTAQNVPKPLSDYRDASAWVLLGEPGAGKTMALQHEAHESGGIYCTMREFLHDPPPASGSGEMTLFVDALDEAHFDLHPQQLLYQFRHRLRQGDYSRFRLTCRAADWYGDTDRQILQRAISGQALTVLQLEPLSRNDIANILVNNHAVHDPQAFISRAEDQGIADLLVNPQTLDLLAKSVTQGSWPDSKQATFELACAKLIAEPSKSYLIGKNSKNDTVSGSKMLETAGYLCAALLLSDNSGIANISSNASDDFPAINEFNPPNSRNACAVIKTAVFKSRKGVESQVVPCHRSIAEYLGASWLAQQLDSQGLPLSRLMNLLVSRVDNRPITNLRGLYSWLALLSIKAREPLIETDALTVVLYGDVASMPGADKKRVLNKLQTDVMCQPALRWDAFKNPALRGLADDSLIPAFKEALLSADTSNEATLAFKGLVLDILEQGPLFSSLVPVLHSLVLDPKVTHDLRATATRLWLKYTYADRSEGIQLLRSLSQHQVNDPNYRLLGEVLYALYPEAIPAEQLLNYLQVTEDFQGCSTYRSFWSYQLLEVVPDEHLPILLDQLSERKDLTELADDAFWLRTMIDKLLVQGIVRKGIGASDAQLFNWLGIGCDEWGDCRRSAEARTIIDQWLSKHPQRYKNLLALCFRRCENSPSIKDCIDRHQSRFLFAKVPVDLGKWHLQQASYSKNSAVVKLHLTAALKCLFLQQGSDGLSLETVEDWLLSNPAYKSWVEDNLLFFEFNESHWQLRKKSVNHRQQALNEKQQRTQGIHRYLNEIRQGTAAPAILAELAAVWTNQNLNTQGDTPQERFEHYCDDAITIYQATAAGFKQCLKRPDIPSASEIIELNLRSSTAFLSMPCLIGVALCWEEDGQAVLNVLPESTQQSLVAFHIIRNLQAQAPWFNHLIDAQPKLIAPVLIEYVSLTLKLNPDQLQNLYPLARDKRLSYIMKLALPDLLKNVPNTLKTQYQHHLEYLLEAALHYPFDGLAQIIADKLDAKRMSVKQKTSWLTLAALLEPTRYETQLWRFVGNHWLRAQAVCEVIMRSDPALLLLNRFSASSLARLIILLVPHTEVEWPDRPSEVSPAMRLGNRVRSLINQIAERTEVAAYEEIQALLKNPSLLKLKPYLQDAAHRWGLLARERNFYFPNLQKITQILSNLAPVNEADLFALTLAYLDDIARNIRLSNADLYRQFWTESKSKKKNSTKKKTVIENNNFHKEENSCRDALLKLLRDEFRRVGVDCQPEVDYVNNKKADIRVSCKTFALPIEIKGEWHSALWTALKTQLIKQYAHDGYAIYVVLWFGGTYQEQAAQDGGKKPTSAQELQERLFSQLNTEQKTRIAVRVIDVSWPQ